MGKGCEGDMVAFGNADATTGAGCGTAAGGSEAAAGAGVTGALDGAGDRAATAGAPTCGKGGGCGLIGVKTTPCGDGETTRPVVAGG
jgi:hypothetical protein